MQLRLVCSIIICCVSSFASAAEKPNIVLIMADDMGYTDIGCYGGEIDTPTLDQLARNGLRFTQFYNTSRCCPTRAALLTGLYSHQAGIGHMTDDRGYDAYRGDLAKNCVTIAETLNTAGYKNYMSGKWHVTRHTRPNGDKSNWPLQRGFDRFYGTITGAGSFYDPTTLCRGNTYITPENDPGYQPEEFYYTDAISDNAATFIEQHRKQNGDSPFFLYVAYTSAHWPMHAPKEDVAKYRGIYYEGYGATRQQRFAAAKREGVIDEEWKLTPDAVDWYTEKNTGWNLQCMEVYAAMVDRMDRGIGRIVKTLKEQNAFDNTIVIYLQDNGGCAEGMGRRSNANQRAKFDFKPFGPNDLQPKIWPPMQTRDGRWVATGPQVSPGPADSYVAYGVGWANVSNTPFRGYKHDGYEGGISTPFIVHWPKGIPVERNGKLVHTPSHLIDLMATCVDVSGAMYPKARGDQTVQPLEGVSLSPLFSGGEFKRSSPIFFEHEGNRVARQGRWKIVSAFRRGQPRRWELYDMEADRTETTDVSEQHPEETQRLVTAWEAWAKRVGVQPWPVRRPMPQPKRK